MLASFVCALKPSAIASTEADPLVCNCPRSPVLPDGAAHARKVHGILRRIGIEDSQVAELAGCDRAGMLADTETFGGCNGNGRMERRLVGRQIDGARLDDCLNCLRDGRECADGDSNKQRRAEALKEARGRIRDRLFLRARETLDTRGAWSGRPQGQNIAWASFRRDFLSVSHATHSGRQLSLAACGTKMKEEYG